MFPVRRIAKARNISKRKTSQSEIQKGEIKSDKLFSEAGTSQESEEREQDITESEDIIEIQDIISNKDETFETFKINDEVTNSLRKTTWVTSKLPSGPRGMPLE